MPTLTIVAENLPEACLKGQLHLALQLKTGYRYAEDFRFVVEYEVRPDRAGSPQPVGDSIQRQPDGRRFVYLAWLEGPRVRPVMVGRIKIQFDTIPLALAAEETTVAFSATSVKSPRISTGSVPLVVL